MPMQFQTIEIKLTGGLAEHDDPRTVIPGQLVSAENIEFDKNGALNKRRGYSRPSVGVPIGGTTTEQIFSAVVAHGDELLLFGYDILYAVASRNGALPGSLAIVKRGVVPRGNIIRQDIFVGRGGAG